MKRYGVFLERNPFLNVDPENELFARVQQMPKVSDDEHEGEIPTRSGRSVKLRAKNVLGEQTGFFVTQLAEPDRLELLKTFPTLSIEEDGEGRMARYAPEVLVEAMAAAVPKLTITIEVVDEDGSALPNVDVRLIVDPVGPVGAVARTGAGGAAAKLFVNAAHTKATYVTAAPEHSYWPSTRLDVALTDGMTLTLRCATIASSPDDNVDKFFAGAPRDGKGVVVAIVDGGVGPHRDLKVTVAEPFPGDTDVADNGIGHGTHVAGIVRRMAPDAELRSYRVFMKDSEATNASIVAAAIRHAVLAGAHLVNVSITFDQENAALRQVLQLAQAKGVVCVCAAGNSGGAVLYPARLPQALGVAACARVGCWPGKALDYQLRMPPGTTFADAHAAAFTCFGAEVTVTAPGVGIASTFPNDRRAVMSGTSMSAPVVTGLLATALSRSANFLQLPADDKRTAAAMSVAVTSTTLLGLPVGFEGHGVPFLT